MKRNILSVVAIGIGFCTSAFSHTTIYNLQQAYATHAKSTYFIQTNSFTQQNNAYRYQKHMQAQTKYPVRMLTKILHNQTFYQVVVGPIVSIHEMQKIANLCFQAPTSHAAIKPPVAIQKTHEITVSQTPNKHRTAYIAAGAGGIYPTVASQMKVNNGSDFPAPYNMDIYSTQTSGNAVVDLQAGYRWQQDRLFIPAYSIGLMWQYAINNNVGSNITQYSDPTFLNYTYNWETSTNALLAVAKLNLIQYRALSPYLNGGIGAAFNQTSHYSEQALPDVTPRVSPGFKTNNSTGFSYIAGAGIDYALSSNLFVSAGYNYINFGSLSSGSGVGTWSGQKLNLGSVGANEFLVNVNYLFDGK